MSDSPDANQARKENTANLFGQTAPDYDRVGPRFFSHFGRKLVELAKIPAGARVLDVACGRGAVLFAAAETVGASGSTVGIDLALPMIEQTRIEAAQSGLGNVTVLQMDGEELKFPDASFDVVLCGLALFFFPRLERALAEIRRVLVPGGTFATTTWNKDGAFGGWYAELARKFDPSDAPKEPVHTAGQPVFDSVEGMRELLERAGLTEIQVTSETVDFVYANVDEWWSSLYSHGMRSWLNNLNHKYGEARLEEFKAEAFQYLEKTKQTDGIHQTFSALYTLAKNPMQ